VSVSRWRRAAGVGYTAAMTPTPSRQEMLRAFLSSDGSYDGLFYTGVRTTGIFCRPSCPARKPKMTNVEFFTTVGEALFSGYRACKRCDPLGLGHSSAWVTRLLADVEDAPDRRLRDVDLRRRGLEPATVRRHFQKHYGMTFQAYCRSRRMGNALRDLRNGSTVDDVVFTNGYESHSGFRDAFLKTFGQPPARGRGVDPVIVAWIDSPLGPLIAGATSAGVCLLEFTQRRMLEAQLGTIRRRFGTAIVPGRNPHLDQLQQELREYFAGRRQTFTVSLQFPGSPFEERVWSALLRIPYGATESYESLARALDRPRASRAVGSANGRNRIAIVIPCHRVVTKAGTLGGYGGGLWRKHALLHLERTGTLPQEASRDAKASDSVTGSRQEKFSHT
jgi:AraC family transcriptional regulator, regulatory protein of adaptative response / methylated-DNA-[protein]-cysteine methyltransferase